MRTHQKGFSILEIILVIAVIGLIGAVVWLFVTNQKGADEKLTSASPSPSTTSKPAGDSTASWYTYTPSAKQYSIKVADGWTLHKKTDGDTSLYSTGSLGLQAGTPGKVVDTTDELGMCGYVTLDYLPYAKSEEWTSTLTTASGLEVKTSTKKDELGVSGGGMSYSYGATKGDRTVYLSYSSCKDGPDNHDVVEQVVKTLTIN